MAHATTDLRLPFVPEENGLDTSWRLTKYSDLKGWGCKVPRETLLRLLEGLNNQTTTTFLSKNSINNNNNEQNFLSNQLPQPSIGIGLDSCVIPLRHSGLNLIQTTDFFYPLIEGKMLKWFV